MDEDKGLKLLVTILTVVVPILFGLALVADVVVTVIRSRS
jgi:hypothetical protein